MTKQTSELPSTIGFLVILDHGAFPFSFFFSLYFPSFSSLSPLFFFPKNLFLSPFFSIPKLGWVENEENEEKKGWKQGLSAGGMSWDGGTFGLRWGSSMI